MENLIKNVKKLIFVLMICIELLIPTSVSAEEYSQNSSETAVQFNEIIEEKESVIQEKDQQIEELIEQNNRNQKTIEDYRALYSTWTGIVAVLLAVFGVAIPIILPFIINKINKHKLDDEIKRIQQDGEEQYKKLMLVQNALALSSLEDYWASNECLKKLQEKFPDDEYIKIYIARNSFRDLHDTLNGNRDKIPEYEDQLYETINLFIDWYYETDGKLLDELMIGSVFGSSTVHEVSMLISFLGNCEETNVRSDFIKICKKASQYILDTLNIKSEDELFDWDQTDVFIMNYKQINFYLCEAYYRNKSISLKQQLQKTIRLYDADDFSREDDNLQKCRKMLEEIG